MELTAFIKNLCRKGESTEIEFKSAAGGFPGSFWETYSAFGNTDGGIIVLGIKENNHKFFPDKLSKKQITDYKKQYWDDVNNHSKVNICLTQEKDVVDTEFEGSAILVVRIPRAIYSQRPVYLTLNPFGHTFVRRHEGDYLLDDDGVRTMFADDFAAKGSYGTLVGVLHLLLGLVQTGPELIHPLLRRLDVGVLPALQSGDL